MDIVYSVKNVGIYLLLHFVRVLKSCADAYSGTLYLLFEPLSCKLPRPALAPAGRESITLYLTQNQSCLIIIIILGTLFFISLIKVV